MQKNSKSKKSKNFEHSPFTYKTPEGDIFSCTKLLLHEELWKQKLVILELEAT